ncbi:tyrosine-protein phosphatase [Plantactinospora siamensis]|uniref:Tyrosine-protein phosphatase n=1 Tax=Plantactinospora siamensis TaxID=555372 RepID=A0ABV6NXP8_9ACTN
MRLDWPDCRNARDLAGLPAGNGRRTRPGALLRSDDHHRLTPAAVAAIRSSGVALILDLRWARECADFPSPFAADPVYRHLSVLDDVLPYDPPADSYAPMLDHYRRRIADAVRMVAGAPPGGVLVHCTAGRDRTGVLVGVLLSTAGVAPADVAADYARTEGCSPLPMANSLRHLAQRYGGVESYLVGGGLDAAELSAVRDRLCEPAT